MRAIGFARVVDCDFNCSLMASLDLWKLCCYCFHRMNKGYFYSQLAQESLKGDQSFQFRPIVKFTIISSFSLLYLRPFFPWASLIYSFDFNSKYSANHPTCLKSYLNFLSIQQWRLFCILNLTQPSKMEHSPLRIEY